jgi:hypothetical protein
MIIVSIKVADFFLTKQPYVDVFGANRPFPVVAPEGTSFPFANNYTEMATLLESIIPAIQDEYDFQAATMDFVEDNQSFVGIINFLINQ